MIPDTYHSNAHISARIDVHLANAISSMQSSDFAAVTVHIAPFFRLLFPRTPDYPYWSIFVHRDRPTNLSKNSPTHVYVADRPYESKVKYHDEGNKPPP